MLTYAKMFSNILDSTVWCEDNPTRILWITLLAMADQHGVISCTIPGLANRAKISLDECKAALAKFMEPDEYSWSKEEGGRRIREVEGGWFLINHAKYKEMLSKEDRRQQNAVNQRNFRARNRDYSKQTSADRKQQSAMSAHTDTDIDTDINTKSNTTVSETDSQPTSDAEDAIRLIALTHPANIPPIRKKPLEPTGVPVDQLQAIVEACTRDSAKLVLEGTQALALAVSYWPPERWRFVPNPVKFWRSSEYHKDPAVWQEYLTAEQVRDLKRKAEARIGSHPSQLPEKPEAEPEPDLPPPSVEDRIARCRAVIESETPDFIRLRWAEDFLSNVVATEGKRYAVAAPLIAEAKNLLAQSRRKKSAP